MQQDTSVRTGPVPMLLTKSRFFIDAFNTAIIDGPLRIYFSDKHETEALHIYFEIQESLAKQGLQLTSLSGISQHTFVMLYPSEKDFDMIFTNASENVERPGRASQESWKTDEFGENIIFGLKNYDERDLRREISTEVSNLIRTGAAL